ncbi:BREX-2 system adenine-specific DNA-methyltransferase PglX [Belnapia rosea]|uniref:site-specific DNA-methyltransferase (adenine-specific) n=1 Tax=Belnapia rosea TaxID=938405 RepID=A0A1G7AT27_9PROT|nr:BREX-2 system adenine-specific DNA-methyltransferase PglX [Belnapia rosea]SDE17941.1 Type I restriction-modification system, DNA methylase subunit [Belnapia rosea]
MVNAERLLDDLKKLRKKLEADLRGHHASSAGRAAVEAEWQEARDTRRTADTFETFFGAAVDQAAVHWILALVFLRFLEDNGLLDRPLIAGAGERLELAQMRQREHFRAHPTDSDAEYLLAMFGEVARLPGLRGLYDPDHNPLFRLPVSGDGAKELFDFFRQRGADTGAPVHDFADPDWNTRFLGDLYQDLSEEARKRFALLQTPDFVEAWILSRTLDPAIREFGHEQVRMIDPTCGSGHFLLGGFARLLEEWRRHAPEMPPAAQAQKALDAVAGVDLNPFAVEIARFRLLVAALKAAGETRLASAPDFRLSLAVGDSLLHGRQRDFAQIGDGFDHVSGHFYSAEDAAGLKALLAREYHAVVGNPPYITPKDAAMRDAYRARFESCHMKYGLGAPFTERFFGLAQRGTRERPAGFVGLIVANSFMKREFGRKLIEGVLSRLDLTHVVDCSGAYIPGHGTPTVIMFGRHREPVGSVVRTVRGIRGEPEAPEDPARGLVWSAIVTQTDLVGSESTFISSEDTPREVLSRHPWNIGGGGAADVQELMEESSKPLIHHLQAAGISAVTGADDAYVFENAFQINRLGGASSYPFVVGEEVRDYQIRQVNSVVWTHLSTFEPAPETHIPTTLRALWPTKSYLKGRKRFGTPMVDRGLKWYEFQELYPAKLASPLTIVYPVVSTHNHFVFDRCGGKIFNSKAAVLKLRPEYGREDHLQINAILNSSAACFWLKQACHNKGLRGIGGGITAEAWEQFIEISSTRLESFPVCPEYVGDRAIEIDRVVLDMSACTPQAACHRTLPKRSELDTSKQQYERLLRRAIALQEEIDWQCYGLYGLHQAPPEYGVPPPLNVGERAFEIVMARRAVRGDLKTAWFERHRAAAIVDVPVHWPEDYRATVEKRIALIESDPTIGLIERPEYKRRWSSEPWEKMEQGALRAWLLDRLEDPRFWDAADPRIVTTRNLADATRADAEFQSVAELYVGRVGFDLEALVAELAATESAPFLAALRYSETGLRKRADWEATWEKQRAEDAIDAELAARRDEFLRAAWSRQNPRGEGEPSEAYAARMVAGVAAEAVQQAADAAISAEAKRRKVAEVGDIPVPPKYRTPDFLSATFWGLRGGLDVPKERFVSFPHCARDADPSLPILWAGHDHLARARALASLYVERRDTDGWPSVRLLPMLAGLLELVPWLRQWHNDIDAETGLRMGDYFAGFIEEEARERGLTIEDLRNWTPPAPARRTRTRRAAA